MINFHKVITFTQLSQDWELLASSVHVYLNIGGVYTHVRVYTTHLSRINIQEHIGRIRVGRFS